jgi:predicted DNA-binding protein (MmcQ/YjbR family)
MARHKSLAAAEAVLRDFALGYPGAVEEHPWDHIAIKVKNKMFVILAGLDDRLTVTAKLPSSGRMALALPFATPTGYALGKSGWVTAEFAPDDPIPIDRMREWIEESYRAIAPKKLVAELDNPDSAKPPAPTARKQPIRARNAATRRRRR